MNLQKQYAETEYAAAMSNSPAVRPAAGPIEDVSVTLTSARELSVRVQALADRALGSVPEEACGGAKLPGGGVLGAMRDDALSTREIVEDGMRALSRLEQVLA